MLDQDKALLLIGGGRWARVYLSVLSGMALPGPIIVVSRHGGSALDEALASATQKSLGNIRRADDLDAALLEGPVGAAIIANAARAHVQTAETLLGRGIPVLVEKPVALSEEEAARLTALARSRGVRLMPGHVLSQCTYLKNFFTQARHALGDIANLELTWRDPAGEARYGETKAHDAGLGLAEDVGPHVATILALGLGAGSGSAETVAITRGGLDVATRGRWAGAAFSLSMTRGAPSRERQLVLRNAKGENAMLDFSTEPGTMTVGGVSGSADPNWPHLAGPLALQIQTFLTSGTVVEAELAAILETTAFIAGLAANVRAAQADWLQSLAADPASLVAMQEVLAPRAVAASRVGPGDSAALEALARAALQRLSAQQMPNLEAILDALLAEA